MPQPVGEDGAHRQPKGSERKATATAFKNGFSPFRENFGWILLCLLGVGQEEGGCTARDSGTRGLGFSSMCSGPLAAKVLSLITGLLEGLERSQQPMEPFLCLSPRG